MNREIKRLKRNSRQRVRGRVLWLPILLLSVVISLSCVQAAAQSPTQFARKLPASATPTEIERELLPATKVPGSAVADRAKSGGATGTRSEDPSTEGGASNRNQSQFRVERAPMIGGAELLTIFGRLDGMRTGGLPAPEVPLVSVVRDTLSDDDPENDRLRYVWILTYTQPTMMKRIASAIPFLYEQVGSKHQASKGTPTPILDLANTSQQTWNHFFWTGLQNIFLDSYGIPLKAASRSYRRHAADYRTAHVTQALSI